MVEAGSSPGWLDRQREQPLPLPGGGASAERFAALMDYGRQDLSLARVLEAHTDALAILAEAGRAPRPGALYGVWASDGGPQGKVTAMLLADGRWHLIGTKQYCTGATFATAALITAHHDDAVLMFDVSLEGRGVRPAASSWATPAMADTATGPVHFDVLAPSDAQIGGPGWYLQRPGFWHGAVGPAACWAGGAVSLVESAVALGRRDPHSRAQVGALEAAAWGMQALFKEAGREIDADPDDGSGQARRRALKLRHLIERHCTDIMDRFGRATGPQLLAHDAHVARQQMALAVYIRQCHCERDLETIPR